VAISLLLSRCSPSRTAVGASAELVCEECAEDEYNATQAGRAGLRFRSGTAVTHVKGHSLLIAPSYTAKRFARTSIPHDL
jgi:hypothetical protein